MEKENIQALIVGYNSGKLTAQQTAELEQLIEAGVVNLSELNDVRDLEENLMALESPSSSLKMDDAFYEMLAKEKKTSKRFSLTFDWSLWAPRLAFASVTLILGFAGGYFLRPSAKPAENNQISELSQQVSDLQEMMMLSLLEKESATERLKAVSLTNEMDQASQKVTAALIETLNNDENVNVRLAALDALKPYVSDDKVREELIRSIAKQKSPLVQVAMAELMVALQAKSSVEEWKRILEDKQTPPDVRKKIQETIEVLI
ncbi:MAG TPA: HEAT repeat domain-containing protein [Ohtaekwangia sp.]